MRAADPPSRSLDFARPRALGLGVGDVHVWRTKLADADKRVLECLRTLSMDEQLVAGRFHFFRDRERYIVARGLLRIILSAYLEIQPERLRFDYSPYGKPSLVHRLGESSLSFNLSHSCRLVLYGVTLLGRIGIDVEQTRDDLPIEQMAECYFSPWELAAFRALPEDLRTSAFFTCWTRKEAYIKARGAGLSMPTQSFSVTVDPREPARLLESADGLEETLRWTLRDLRVAPGYVAALAFEGAEERLIVRDWPTK